MRRLLFASLLTACGQTTEITAPHAEDKTELIGGFAAVGLNGIGSIGAGFAGSYHGPLCTATLVGPSTVLASAHCGSSALGIIELFFVSGDDNADNPAEQYAIVAGEALEGQDLFIFHTDRAVAAKPVALGRVLSDSDLGHRGVAVGYGTDAQRDIGAVTMNALGGKQFELLFGSYESFLNNLADLGEDVPACLKSPTCAAELDALWNTELRPTDLFAGLKPGDAQVCGADAGGPLLQTVYKKGVAEQQVFGVLSHAWSTRGQPCYGAFYATFDAETLARINAASTWVNPCSGTTGCPDTPTPAPTPSPALVREQMQSSMSASDTLRQLKVD